MPGIPAATLAVALWTAGMATVCAQVQPLTIDLFDDDAPALERERATVTYETDIELSEHYQTGGGGLRSLGLDATTGLAFDPGPDTRVNLSARIQSARAFDARRGGLKRRSRLELDESWVRHRLTPALSLTFGRQVIAWGHSDFYYGAQLTDRVNPRDFSEPVLIDLDDSRLPVLATRLQRLGPVEWELVATHERRFHRFDRAGGDFDPLLPLRQQGLSVQAADEGVTALGGIFVRVARQLGGTDVALVASRSRRNSPVLQSLPGARSLALRHPQQNAVGFSLNRAVGSYVFKTEHVWTASGVPHTASQSRDKTLQSMLGLDYFGFDDWLLVAELSNEHRINPSAGTAPVNEGNLSLAASWTPAGRDLEFNALWLRSFPYSARVARLESAFRLNDRLRLRLGAIDYRATDARSFYAPFADRDRLYMSFEIAF